MDDKLVKRDEMKVSKSKAYILPPKPLVAVEEDAYISSLSSIIKRDFFPSLDKLKGAFQAETSAELKAHADKLSLDQFQANFTSEDNQSFNEIIESENSRKRKQYHFFYDAEKDAKQLEYTEKKAIEGISKPVNTWKHETKSALMYGPKDVPLTLEDIPETRGEDKKIRHENTRIGSGLGVVGSGLAAIDDETLIRLNTEKVWKNMAQATPGLFKQDTPLVRGYKMVPSTPDLQPNVDVDPSELMTWGMIESTPILMDSGKTPGFSMAPTPQREVLSKRLSEKAVSSIKKRQQSFKQPLARHASPALAALAKRLGRGKTTDSALKASYTPSPLIKGKSTPIQRSRPISTPVLSTSSTSKQIDPKTSNHTGEITDGLLNL